MEDTEWEALIHPFFNHQKMMKEVLRELRYVVMLCLGMNSLVYRINSSSCVLGRDTALVEYLYVNIVTVIQVVFYVHLHKILSVLQIVILTNLKEYLVISSDTNLVDIN